MEVNVWTPDREANVFYVQRDLSSEHALSSPAAGIYGTWNTKRAKSVWIWMFDRGQQYFHTKKVLNIGIIWNGFRKPKGWVCFF